MSFAVKTIETVSSLGACLRREREARGWTMLKAATVTNIRETYLRAIEEDRLTDLPEEPVRRNFLKRYIAALGGDHRLYATAGTLLGDAPARLEPNHPPTKVRFSLTPEHLKLCGLLVVVLALIGYLGFEAYTLVRPPELLVTAPVDGMLTGEPTIIIRGEVAPGARVFINEKPAPKDARGAFEAPVDLSRGVNIITIEARKKYSKPRTIYRTIIFEGT